MPLDRIPFVAGNWYEFSFQEGYWYRFLKIQAVKGKDDWVYCYEEETLTVQNGNSDPETWDMDDDDSREDFEGNISKVLWAFEERFRRKDDRDVCTLVSESE